jgi:hypothetical protein
MTTNIFEKIARDLLHAHIRGAERLKLSPEVVDNIQKQTDKMWYSYGRKKLQGEKYYSPIRDHNKSVVGFATFQRVGQPNRNRLILTTILSGHMKPRGDNIGSFFDLSVPGQYPMVNEPEKFKGMDPIPDATKNN